MKFVAFVVGNRIKIYSSVEKSLNDLFVVLNDKLSIDNPEYLILKQQIKNLKYNYKANYNKIKKMEYFIESMPRKFCFADKVGKYIEIGIGFKKIFEKVIDSENINCILENRFIYPEIKVNKKLFNRDYQYECVKDFFEEKFGIVSSPTGSGKTRISRHIVETLLPHVPKDLRIIYVCDQKYLVLQTEKVYSETIKGVGIIGGGVRKNINSKVICATIQSIYKNEDLLNTIFCIVVDECDLFATEKRNYILKNLPNCKYGLFLSGTPFSRFSKIKEMRLREVGGKVFFKIKEGALQNKGFLSKGNSIFVNYFEFSKIEKIKNWLQLYDAGIVSSNRRNNLILSIISICKKIGLKSLVVTERVLHAEKLYKNSKDTHVKAILLTGNDDSNLRKEAIEKIQNGDISCIFTTRIFRRGIDIPELQVVINAAGMKSDTMLIQAKGRMLRMKKDSDNVGFYIDIVDNHNPILKRHSDERINTLTSKECNFKPEICSIDQLSGLLVEFLNKNKLF